MKGGIYVNDQILYMALLTLHENNFRGLHWKLTGPGFETNHVRFGEYYDKLGELMDQTAELMITQGINPVGFATLMEIIQSDEVDTSYVDMSKDYDPYSANVAAAKIFDELYQYASKLASDDSLPVDVQDAYTTHAGYYRIEGKYKLGRALTQNKGV